MRIGRIPFLNVFPYYRELVSAPWCTLVEGSPRRLGELAERGEIDAAPLPAVDTFRLEDTFEPLAPWGIASRGAVQSVLLFSRRPFAQLSGGRVLLSGDSATSAALTRVLFSEAGLGEVTFATGDDPAGADAYLAIGDRALRLAREGAYPFCTDLGLAWYRQTGLPFVFARWVVRRDLPAADRATLGAALARSVAAELPAALPNAAGLTDAEARDYLRHIIFALDLDCLAGLDLFREKLHVHA